MAGEPGEMSDGETPRAAPNPDNVQVPITEDVEDNRKKKCLHCCKRFLAFLFSTVGLTCLMVGYTVFGGFIFMKLEAPHELALKANVKNSRRWHATKLWDLNIKYNVFYPENWTDMAEKILANYTKEIYYAAKNQGWDGKDELAERQWTFAGALLYSITVITTIGKSFFIVFFILQKRLLKHTLYMHSLSDTVIFSFLQPDCLGGSLPVWNLKQDQKFA